MIGDKKLCADSYETRFDIRKKQVPGKEHVFQRPSGKPGGLG